jgi:hypothetical protein
MTAGRSGTGRTDAVGLDLLAYKASLATMLRSLLFARDRDALVRWCKVRVWVENALAGDEAPDLQTIELAVAYLTERASKGSRGDDQAP